MQDRQSEIAPPRSRPQTASVGRRNFDNIRVPGADMHDAKSDGVSYNGADLSNVIFTKAELSLSAFHGTNLSGAILKDAVLICSSFTSDTVFSNGANQVDISGCLLLLATYDGKNSVTREWLSRKQVKNAQNAITDLVSLSEMLTTKKIDCDTVKYYMEKINSIYGLLNSMKIRREQSLFVDPNWLFLLEFSTQENLSILKQAYILLNHHVLENEHKQTAFSFRK